MTTPSPPTMFSLLRGANSKALQIRSDHLSERDRDLCYPITDDVQVDKTQYTRLADLPAVEVEVQDGDVDILSSDVQQLVKGIQSGQWTSLRLVQAFARSARRAHLKTNCITVSNFEAALKRARELDAEFAASQSIVGPFHGIPFSFKENNNVKGLTTTVGYTSWVVEGPATTTAALALMVEHLGGIIIVKTNIPQTMLSFECSNPLYGRTTNPYSPNHTCGGSSGGEAALLASDGAAVGFGSDIGGSLRMPAGYCGIYALKPTSGRFPGKGTRTAVRGFEGIPVSFAPMCRSAADLEFISTELIKVLHPNVDSPQDPFTLQRKFATEEMRPAPLRPAWLNPLKVISDTTHPRKLRIGYYYCDGLTKTSPACVRAVDESLSALRSRYTSQVELIEINPAHLNTLRAVHIFLALVTSDNFNGLLGPLTKDGIREPMDSSLFLPVFAARAPRWIKALLRFVATYLIGDPSFAYIVTAGGSKSASQYYEHIARRREFEQDWLKNIWESYNLDGIICPIQSSPAVPNGACAKLSTLSASTILYNVLDYSIAICPVTRVDRDVDDVVNPPKGYEGTQGFETCSKMISMGLYGEKVYDAKAMHGLPVGVQVVAKKFEDEKAIGLMRLLDTALAESGRHEKNRFGAGSSLRGA